MDINEWTNMVKDNSKTAIVKDTKPSKVYIGENLITDVDDWNRLTKKFSEYEKKAKAFDLLVDHVEILQLMTGSVFSKTPMTKNELEQLADAMGIKINWLKDSETVKEETTNPIKEKEHWWNNLFKKESK